MVVPGVVGSLIPANAYEAIVCVAGRCVAATFTLPPPSPGICSVPNGDGSLCCETTWPKLGEADCRASGSDLVLVVPWGTDAGLRQTKVNVSIIDSEGDATLVQKGFEVAPNDAACTVDCREIRHVL